LVSLLRQGGCRGILNLITDSASDSIKSKEPEEEMEVSFKRQPFYPKTSHSLSVGALGRSRGVEEEVKDDSKRSSRSERDGDDP
jgi:hypothetical protein